MTAQTRAFHVIEGGLDRTALLADQAILTQEGPHHSAAELAADMAEIYAMALLRDVPFAAAHDPHHEIIVDTATRFTLHELLCELRSLTWFDRRALPSCGAGITAFSRAGQGDPGHRRALRWNGDGQLTLRTLFRGGVRCDGHDTSLMPFLAATARRADAADADSPPDQTAPMSAWITWVSRSMGAELPLPTAHHGPRRSVKTPRDLAVEVHTGHPGQAFFAVALRLMARGAARDPGLCGPDTLAAQWSKQRILALLAAGVRRATALAQVRAGRVERLSRPAVTAARFAVMHARDDLETGPAGAVLRAAIDELTLACPNLLHWVSRMNAARNPRARFRESLLLPAAHGDAGPLHAADSAAQVLVSGALATLLKAVFDLPEAAETGWRAANGAPTADMLNRMAGDIALGRTIAGGYYHAENHADLRMGEALGLQILREAMEADNLTASVSLRALDGDPLHIAANPRVFDQGHATLRRNGVYDPWPADTRPSTAHLTEVV